MHDLLIYPASHDVPYDMVGGICLDGISTGVRYGHSIALIQNGRPEIIIACVYKCMQFMTRLLQYCSST